MIGRLYTITVLTVILALLQINYYGDYYNYGSDLFEIRHNWLGSDKAIYSNFTANVKTSGNEIFCFYAKDTWKFILQPDGITLCREYKGKIYKNGEKITDPELKTALQLYIKRDYAKAEPGLKKYLMNHPTDLAMHVSYFDNLVNVGKLKEAHTELAKFENNPELKTEVYYTWMVPRIKYKLIGIEKTLAGENAWDDYQKAIDSLKHPILSRDSEKVVLGVKQSEMPLSPIQIACCQQYIAPNLDVIQTLLQTTEKAECYLPDSNIHNKATMLADSLVLYGRLQEDKKNIPEAVKAFRRVVRLGQQMNQGYLITHLIAFSIRSRGEYGFASLLKEGIISQPEDAKLVLETLKELRQKDPLCTKENLHEFEPPSDWDDPSSSLPASLVRAHQTETQLILLETKSAAIYYLLKEGHWPENIQVLVPDYLPELHKDTFAQNPIVLKPGYAHIIYSYGVDSVDDHGTIQYDPTNGAFSKGDLVFP